MNQFIKVARPLIGEEEIVQATKVLQSDILTNGPKTREFEEKYSNYIGTKYGIATSGGTSALHLALLSAGIKPNEEVIVPSLTFFATIEAVLHCGAVPIFADIDPNTWCIDPVSVKENITDLTRAVIPVHLFGQPCEMNLIKKYVKEESLDAKIIEDCAQAHGARYEGKKVGSLGYAGCWSFFPTKNMCTGGEGGMITTNRKHVESQSKLLRSHGMTDRHTHSKLGYNYKLSEVEAAIGIVQLSRLDKMNEKRIVLTDYLRSELESIDWLIPQEQPKNTKSVFFWAGFKVDERKLGNSTKWLIERLARNHIGTRYRYEKPLYYQPILTKQKRKYVRKPINVENITGKIIGLPNYPGLTIDQVDYIAKTLRKIKNECS